MKTLFIQKKNNNCFLVCLANLFNDYGIVERYLPFIEKNGTSIKQGQNIVNDLSDNMSLSIVLDSPKPVKTYTPVFDWDENDFPNNFYMIFIGTIYKTSKLSHAVLIFKKNKSDTLEILDPLVKKSKTISKFVFFKSYNST